MMTRHQRIASSLHAGIGTAQTLANAPGLTRQTSALGARSTLELAGFDRLPVVGSQGELTGVVAHNMLKEATTMENNNTQRPTHDQPTARQTRRAFTVHPGMNVFSANGVKLGLVDRLFLDHGVVTGFLVSVGPIGPRHKQLDFDKVDHLEGETIILTMNESAFGDLPDANSLDQ